MSTIKEQFDKAISARTAVIARLRPCAAFSIPTLLPEEYLTEDGVILRPYQNLGASGLQNLAGKVLLAVYPTDIPFFSITPDVRLLSIPDIATNPHYTQFSDACARQEKELLSEMDRMMYRSRKRMSIEQVLGLGTSVARVNDANPEATNGPYSIQNFRLDQFTLRRDHAGRPLRIMLVEQYDPNKLLEAWIAAADLNVAELNKKDEDNRAVSVYTMGECQRDNSWNIRQEIEGKEIAESNEKVSPFLINGFIEVPGEHYSRGFVEGIIADLRSLNAYCQADRDLAGICSWILCVTDETKGFFPKDFLKTNGSTIAGRVTGNQVDGMALFHADKIADTQFINAGIVRLNETLSERFLMEHGTQPTGDRVTATQIMRLAKELDGAMGGIYSQIAEDEQRPFLDRVMYMMKRDNRLTPLPKGDEKYATITILTGVEALSRQMTAQKLMEGLAAVAQFPNAQNVINWDEATKVILQGAGVNTDTIIKSVEQLKAEQQQMMQAQAQMMAAQQAIQSTGKIAEQQAAQPPAQ